MRHLFVPLAILCCGTIAAQEREKTNTVTEEQLEYISGKSESVTEDDAAIQERVYYRRHPINLNEASADELNTLQLLSPVQVDNFLRYRQLLGKLVSIYELQAIPGWDVSLIQILLPYCTVADNSSLREKLSKRWMGGEQSLLFRYSRQIEKQKGYNTPSNSNNQYYQGGSSGMFLRYRYNYKQLLQWGITADKDPGEPFFKGNQRWGFDFYSFHLYAVKIGLIKTLALGDYTVNMGQGLIQWQSLAFGKNADALMINRAAGTLRPYTSAGEFNFHRGAGITIGKNKWELTFFASLRRLSSHQVRDTSNGQWYVSSLKTDGYHRTQSESGDCNNLEQFTSGAHFAYTFPKVYIGVNIIHHQFSRPFRVSGQPYDLFSLNGNKLINASIDYKYSFRNLYFFGEAATDDQLNKAMVHGLLLSAAPGVDISLLYRRIDKAYQAFNANAFTENTNPVNESGLYLGGRFRPVNNLRIDAYADVFHFPWLKYRVDAPSYGNEYLVQFTYTPGKSVEWYARYRSETKDFNRSSEHLVLNGAGPVTRQDLRVQLNWQPPGPWSFGQRLELIWYDKKGPEREDGLLGYAECSFEPGMKSWSANMRIQYAETGGFNSRIYSYEKDLLYRIAIPFFYGREWRYYVNLQLKTHYNQKQNVGKKLRIDWWLKWSQSVLLDRNASGSGLSEAPGNHKSDIALQAQVIF